MFSPKTHKENVTNVIETPVCASSCVFPLRVSLTLKNPHARGLL